MKAKLLLSTMASLALASTSQAAMIAGWDFSQFPIPGYLTVDGATLIDTLDSNHSDLDPTNKAGIESNLYGRMYLNGQFGSYDTPNDLNNNLYPIDNPLTPDPFQPIDLPPEGSLLANENQAFLTFSSPAACTQQVIEGMPGTNCGDLAMMTYDTVQVVFQAKPNATNPLQWGENWSVSFAARTATGFGTQTIDVEFSPDGSAYVSVGTANINGIDTAYTFAAPAGLSANGFFRLTLNTTGNEYPAIDNVGIAASLVLVPEPGTAMLLLAGLAGLAKAGSRRS